MSRIALLWALIACAMCIATSALAAPMTYQVDVTVTYDELGLIGVGNTHPLLLTIESTTPDTDPTSGEFSALGGGSFDPQLIGTGAEPIDDIVASAISGTWSTSGVQHPVLLNPIPWTIELIGIGLTPDQALPDFDLLTGGTLWSGVDTTPFITGDITGLTLVPEPSTGLLVALGVATLAARRRRAG